MIRKNINKNIPEKPTVIIVKSSKLIKEGNYQEANKEALIESGIFNFNKRGLRISF